MAFPTVYQPATPHVLPDGLLPYLYRELRALRDTLEDILAILPQASSAPPPLSQTKDGMVRVATGAWATSLSLPTTGALVVRINGAWVAA